MKKSIVRISIVIGLTLLSFYIAACGLFYSNQESLFFFPNKLDLKYKHFFEGNYEEINVSTADNIALNNIWFKTDSSKGVIFYLHGSGGSLREWGNAAAVYTNLNYDVFMTDYRGYGKSEGIIENEEILYQDIQVVYDTLKKKYTEDKIIILGYSLGSTFAAKIASTNNPNKLILQAPFYSSLDAISHLENNGSNLIFKILKLFPTSWLIRYRFETGKFIRNCKMPIFIFHGTNDNIIYYGSSLKLQQLSKSNSELILLEGQGHTGITRNQDYLNELRDILKN